MGQVYLKRRETFCCSHRLFSQQLSREENFAIFDKCAYENGHGHNYALEVTVCGEPDPRTGMVMNLVDLKTIIHEEVLRKIDHRHLNLDVPEFSSTIPTTENLALVIWKWLKPRVRLLHEIEVHETDKNMVIYRGE